MVRATNQDRAGCFSADNWCLGFVADGMGGHYGGEQASEIVSQACSRWWNSFLCASQRPAFLKSVEQLRELIIQCHEKIAEITPQGTVCGTTLVLLWIADGEYALFSVGDSRCYSISQRLWFLKQAIQLTHDDVSDVPYLAGKLLRALGPQKCEFSLITGKVHHRTAFALCSDGIYKACPSLYKDLRELVSKKSLKSIADRITAHVDANGAPDNYSLVLIRV